MLLLTRMEPPQDPAIESDLTPLQIIRTETVLSKLPIHHLAKKGRVDIQITRRNPRGEVELKWEVSYSDRYGQPRQLAYKIDTLIVNRRIDDESRPLQKIIRVGTLSQICRELGVPASGKNTNDIRRAMHQNAGAYITAKLTYKSHDGRQRRLEAGFTRYGVAFTGETLPDGRNADGIYIILNDPYREVLDTAPMRPLSYDYLKLLRPASQRFYEIVSYRIYAALKNNWPTARLSYGEYCTYSAQQRYFDQERFRIQMYKVHKPHIESGYLKSVDWESRPDAQGNPDWLLSYTPGPKARAEFLAFNGRSDPYMDQVEKDEEGEQHSFQLTPEEPSGLLAELQRRGVTIAQAKKLLASLPSSQPVEDQLEWVDHLVQRAAPGSFRNPPGFYIAVLRDDLRPPEDFETSAQRRQREQAAEQHGRDTAQRLETELTFEAYRRAEIERHWNDRKMTPEVRDAIERRKRELASRYRSVSRETLEEIASAAVQRDLSAALSLMSFEAFCATQGGVR